MNAADVCPSSSGPSYVSTARIQHICLTPSIRNVCTPAAEELLGPKSGTGFDADGPPSPIQSPTLAVAPTADANHASSRREIQSARIHTPELRHPSQACPSSARSTPIREVGAVATIGPRGRPRLKKSQERLRYHPCMSRY